MTHRTTASFWRLYQALPLRVQAIADQNYALLRDNPNHGSLRLKKVQQLWSVRVTDAYRALAIQHEETLIWFWIGTHDEYQRQIRLS